MTARRQRTAKPAEPRESLPSASGAAGGSPLLSSLARILWLLLALAPLVVLVLCVTFFSVNVPVWDEWTMVPLMQKAEAGTLSFTDLWAPQNQHRILLPRLIVLALAPLTGWDVRYEMALSVLFAVALWVVLVRQAQRSACALGRTSPLWLPALLSLLVFSLSQQENWLSGLQLQIPLNTLTATAALLLLAQPGLRGWRFAGACALALAATASFGAGLLCWPLGALALWWQRGNDRRYLRRALPVWLMLSVACFAAYLHNLGGAGAEAAAGLGRGGEYLRFVFTYLGAPLWFVTPEPAFWLGIVGVLLLSGLALGLVGRRRGVVWPSVQPYLLLALYAVGSAALTGLGRSAGGAAMALAPRYITLSTLWWVAVVGLVALALPAAPLLRRSAQQLALTGGLALVLLGVTYFSLCNSQYAAPVILRHYHTLAPVPEAMRSGDESCLSRIGPFTPEETRPWREFLREHRWSVYR